MLVDYERATGGTVARLGDVLAVDEVGSGCMATPKPGPEVRGLPSSCPLLARQQAPAPGILLLRAGTAAAASRISDHLLTSAIHEEPSRPKSVGMSLRDTGDF